MNRRDNPLRRKFLAQKEATAKGVFFLDSLVSHCRSRAILMLLYSCYCCCSLGRNSCSCRFYFRSSDRSDARRVSTPKQDPLYSKSTRQYHQSYTGESVQSVSACSASSVLTFVYSHCTLLHPVIPISTKCVRSPVARISLSSSTKTKILPQLRGRLYTIPNSKSSRSRSHSRSNKLFICLSLCSPLSMSYSHCNSCFHAKYEACTNEK